MGDSSIAIDQRPCCPQCMHVTHSLCCFGVLTDCARLCSPQLHHRCQVTTRTTPTAAAWHGWHHLCVCARRLPSKQRYGTTVPYRTSTCVAVHRSFWDRYQHSTRTHESKPGRQLACPHRNPLTPTMAGTPSQHNLIRRAAVESPPLLFSLQQQLQKAAGGRPNLSSFRV